jgi:hypothetical protein
MKNRKKTSIIALMLMLAMIITSEAFAFAADGVNDGTDPAATDVQTVDQAEPADQEEPAEEPAVQEPGTEDPAAETGEQAEATEGTDGEAVDQITEDSDENAEAAEAVEEGSDESSEGAEQGEEGKEEEEEETVANVTGLKAYPGYNSITLRWNRDKSVDYYLVQRSTKSKSGYKDLFRVSEGNKKYILSSNKKKINFRDKKNIKKDKKYYYRVYAVKKIDGKNTKSEKPAKAHAKAVRPMYEDITFNETRYLTSHDGKNVSRTFPAGTKVTAEGFGGGRYKFYYKGNLFFVTYTSTRNAKADYLSKTNYDDVTAENFVNECGRSSKTKYLIWVSTYTQHIYVFKGKKKNWKIVQSWECSSGKAASPSPSGFGFNIHTKTYSYSNNIPWWMMYSSYNSIHGKKPEYKIGIPASHGCVRNYNENAKWMYDRCKVGTAIIVN